MSALAARADASTPPPASDSVSRGLATPHRIASPRDTARSRRCRSVSPTHAVQPRLPCSIELTQ
jgi:hypothetical protein